MAGTQEKASDQWLSNQQKNSEPGPSTGQFFPCTLEGFGTILSTHEKRIAEYFRRILAGSERPVLRWAERPGSRSRNAAESPSARLPPRVESARGARGSKSCCAPSITGGRGQPLATEPAPLCSGSGRGLKATKGPRIALRTPVALWPNAT